VVPARDKHERETIKRESWRREGKISDWPMLRERELVCGDGGKGKRTLKRNTGTERG